MYLKPLPQILENITVKDKKYIKTKMQKAIKKANKIMGKKEEF